MVTTGEHLFFIDTRYIVKKLSRKLLEKMGDDSMQRVIGTPCHKVFFHRDSPCVDCPVSRSIAFKTVVEEDLKLENSNDTNHVRHAVATPVTDDNETVRNIIVDCLGDPPYLEALDISFSTDLSPQPHEDNGAPQSTEWPSFQTRAILIDRDFNIILYNDPIEEFIPKNIQNIIGHNLFSVLSYYNQYPIRHQIEDFVLKGHAETSTFRTKADFYSAQWAEHDLIKLGSTDRVDAILILSKAIQTAEEEECSQHRREKIQLLSRFASKISHEIKNPLSLISTNVEFLKNDMTQVKSVEGVFTLLDYVDKVADHVKQVIAILDTVNALKVHNMENVTETDPGQLLNRAVTITLLNRPFPENEIRTTIAEDLPSFYACELNLERAFSELFKSLLYSAGSDGKLKVYLSYLNEQGDAFMFKIRSNNSVQTFFDLEKMLNEFFTSKRKFDISNLGLIIAYATILNHDGSMEIVNVDAGQTEVLIKLPRVPRFN